MQVVNAWHGTESHVDTPPAALRAAVAYNEGIDESNMLLLASDGSQWKETSAAVRIFAYDKTWAKRRPSAATLSSPASIASPTNPANVGGTASERDTTSEFGATNEIDAPNGAPTTEKSNAPNEGALVSTQAANVLAAAQLVHQHMRHNLDAVFRQLRRLSHARAQLQDDVKACGAWPRYVSALRELPLLCDGLGSVLGADDVRESHSTLTSVWSNLERTLVELADRADAMAGTSQTWSAPTLEELQRLAAEARSELIEAAEAEAANAAAAQAEAKAAEASQAEAQAGEDDQAEPAETENAAEPSETQELGPSKGESNKSSKSDKKKKRKNRKKEELSVQAEPAETEEPAPAAAPSAPTAAPSGSTSAPSASTPAPPVLLLPTELTLAQRFLVAVLHEANTFQRQAQHDLRRPLGELNDDLKHAEELKSRVARVIDLPFLFGVLLIESSRRALWTAEFAPVWRQEADRRAEWHRHYGSGSLGALVKRLDKVGGFNLEETKQPQPYGAEHNDATDLLNDTHETEDNTHSTHGNDNNSSSDNNSPEAKFGPSDVEAYLRKLDELRLDDVSRDLRGELGAMRRQFARSMSASISMLAPRQRPERTERTTSVGSIASAASVAPASAAASVAPPAAAEYEARIRRLETLLLQARMGSKTHELDLIRAETRGEARAEAKAEVRAEQQQARIEELGAANRELAGRLAGYTDGLEAVLNAMGLQTSRVDPESGAPQYRVNRVKGLSREKHENKANDAHERGEEREERKSGRSGERTGNERSAGAAGGVNKELSASSSRTAETPSSSLSSARTAVALERLLDQTFVDNTVLYEAATKRFGDVERLARRLQHDNRRLKAVELAAERSLRQRLALTGFRAEDLILFLPTRDPQRDPDPWAAFNAGAPHYFLHPKHAARLRDRDYLIARAAEIERHVVETDAENPFGLPIGVEWFLISIHGEWGV